MCHVNIQHWADRILVNKFISIYNYLLMISMFVGTHMFEPNLLRRYYDLK